MMICITAKGDSAEAIVEESFGRSPYFIIINEESGDIKALNNENAGAMGGVGIKSAQTLIDNNVNVLITGQMGGNAQKTLDASGIEVYHYKNGGTVNEALALYRENKLDRIL